MTILDKVQNVILKRISYPIDKIVNTLIWLLLPSKRTIVLNVWLKHRGQSIRSTNLGDDLNYAIVSHFSKKRVICYKHSYIALFKPVNYMCIGSIVDTLVNKESIIWGSGAIIGDKKRQMIKPKKVLAVRGPLTRDYLLSQGVECPETYGDPVLLLPLLYMPQVLEKKYKLGLIPHYADGNLDSVKEFKEKNGDKVVIINMDNYENWQDVIDVINECELIASSSLHGLIISDAYKIPNVWIKLSERIKGGRFKFHDYFLSCGRTQMEPIDFMKKDIDYHAIEECSKEYTRASYNYDKLLRACPFLSDK